MQYKAPQQVNVQNQSATRAGRGVVADTPQTEQIAQLEAMIDNSPQMEQQNHLLTLMHTSPNLAAQREHIDSINSSPLVTAQREKLNGMFGAAQAKAPIQAKFFADEATTESDEISKAAFLDQLRSTIQGVADQELAAIQQTSENCPYMAKWFTHYQGKDAAYIQRAIARYAPDTENAKNVDEYIGLLAARVRQGLKEHVATGSTDAVPQELVEEKHKPEDFVHIATEQAEQQAEQTAQLSCIWGGGNNAGGGGQPQGGQQMAPIGGQAQVVAPPPANAAIAPGGAHYAVATPNFGAAGGTFNGFSIRTINHAAAGTFDAYTFEVGTDVGFWFIFNGAQGVHGATDLITWHMCRFSGVQNFEVRDVGNDDLAAHLVNHYGMVNTDNQNYMGNRVAILALAIARLNQFGWVLPP